MGQCTVGLHFGLANVGRVWRTDSSESVQICFTYFGQLGRTAAFVEDALPTRGEDDLIEK